MDNYAHSSITATETIRQPEVLQQVDRLRNQQAGFEKLVINLEDKLSSVLAQRKDVGGNAQSAPEPVRVPLAQMLYEHVEGMDAIADRLTSIINRVEL